MVMIPPSGQDRIQLIQTQGRKNLFQQPFRHGRIIDDTQRFSAFTALDPFGNLLQHTVPQVIVDFHFGIACKLKRIRLIIRKLLSAKDHGQTATDNIVQVHQITFLSCIRQSDKAATRIHWQCQECILRRTFLYLLPEHSYCQINILVVLNIQLFDRREPDRNNRTVQMLHIEVPDKSQLFVINLIIAQEIDVFFLQLLGYFAGSIFIFFGIFGIQFIDFFQDG